MAHARRVDQAARPVSEAHAALVGPLLDGLDVIHKAGYLHRDIKPGNIYIREDGSPVLLDFGLGAPARHRAYRRGLAGLCALRAVPQPGQAGTVERHLRARGRALLDGDRLDAARGAGARARRRDGRRHPGCRPQPLPARVPGGDRLGARAFEDQRPQSVAEWREALLGAKAVEGKRKRSKPYRRRACRRRC